MRIDNVDQHEKLIDAQNDYQGVTDPDIRLAFRYAYFQAYDILHPEDAVRYMMRWAYTMGGGMGFRQVEVSFANGSSALSSRLVEQAMYSWIQAYCEMRFEDATQAYKEFETIHPFKDGNGRVGHLLWAIYHRALGNAWPMELPPDLWNKVEHGPGNCAACAASKEY